MALKGIPCERDCPRRAPGCGVTCPDWAEYVRKRDAGYKIREEARKVSDVQQDGYIRMGYKGRQI